MTAGTPRRSVGRNVGVLLATQVLTWGISLILVVALPRYLGSEAIGQYRLANSVWLIAATFITVGTQMLVTLDVARRQRDGIGIVAPAVLARVLSFVVVSMGVAAFVVLAGYASSLALLFVVMGAATLVRTIGDVAIAALHGLEDFASPALVSIVEKVLSTTFILVALVLGAGVEGVAAIGFATAIVQTAIIYRFLARWGDLQIRTTVREAGRVAVRGLPFMFGAFAMVAYHEIDTVVMALLVDDDRIGWYAAADRLTATSLFIPTIVMSALFPTFARLNEQDSSVARGMVERGFRSLLLLGVPIGFGLATISTPLALLLFGEEFRESGPVLAVLSVVLMIMFQTILVGNYAVATGHERYYFSLIFAGVVATIPLDLVLIPWTEHSFENGAIGGALAYIVTESVILVVAVRRFAPHVVNRATLVRLGKCLAGGAAMVAAIWPLRSMVLAVPVAVGAAVYLLAVGLLRTLTSEEREAARGALQRLRGARS